MNYNILKLIALLLLTITLTINIFTLNSWFLSMILGVPTGQLLGQLIVELKNK